MQVRGSECEGSAPCVHEQTSEVDLEGNKEQTGTEQCICGAALCMLHMLMMFPAPKPSSCAGGGKDAASTPKDFLQSFLPPLQFEVNLFLHSLSSLVIMIS